MRRIGPLALSRGNLLWFAAYLVIVAGIVCGLLVVRVWALQTYGAGGEEDWQAWRTAAVKQSTGEGPVIRRPPKSNKPPALILMKDYFAVCLTGAIVISSALFATLMFMFRGAFRTRETRRETMSQVSNSK